VPSWITSFVFIGLSLLQYCILICIACEGAARHTPRVLPSYPSPTLCYCYPTSRKSSMDAYWPTSL
jgi:hypothetical protein